MWCFTQFRMIDQMEYEREWKKGCCTRGRKAASGLPRRPGPRKPQQETNAVNPKRYQQQAPAPHVQVEGSSAPSSADGANNV